MENWKLEDLCVDTMWQIIMTEASFFYRKVNLINYIYCDIMDKIEVKDADSLSTFSKKKLLENNLVKYFAAMREASIEAVTKSSSETTTDVDGEKLNGRGFARLSILSNINATALYSPKTNKNIYLALGNGLNRFNLNNSVYQDKSLFQIIYEYILKFPALQNSTPRAIANSFSANIENEKIMLSLDASFDQVLLRQINTFQKEMRTQKADDLSVNIITDILVEVDKNYTNANVNFSQVLSLGLTQKIMDKNGIKSDK